MATITRRDIAKNISEKMGLGASASYQLVDTIFSEIAESLTRGEEVKIAKIGTFRILDKNARMGRNPKTGMPAVISARRIAAFKPSSYMKK
ncbi:MAG: integration host factor subunit alpha [Rickettsiales bacterium]|jgi:integration host factor subunit alpha|nr:integration host factor subunit alpha [Rickettsiales bacterium]